MGPGARRVGLSPSGPTTIRTGFIRGVGRYIMNPNFARRFAVVGIAVGIAVALSWWFVRIFNPFHLPTLGQAPPNYREPLLLTIFEDSVLLLCPGALLQVFTLEMRGWFSWFMWVLAVMVS